MDGFKLGNAVDVQLCQRLLADFIELHPVAGTAAPNAAEVLMRRSACEAISTCAYQPSGLEFFGSTLSMNRCLLLSGAVAQLMMLPCAFMVREIDVKSAQSEPEVDQDESAEDSKLQHAEDGGRDSSTSGSFEVEKFELRRASPWTIALEVGRTRRFWKFFLLTVLLINIKMIFRHLDATLPKWLLRTYVVYLAMGRYFVWAPSFSIHQVVCKA